MYTYDVIRTDNHPTRVAPVECPSAVAIVHTHPMGSYKGITAFSAEDKALADELKLTMFVYGPNGQMRVYIPSLGADILLFDNLPESPYTPWKDNKGVVS